MMLPTATWSPTRNPVTALLTAVISPVISYPGTSGKTLPATSRREPARRGPAS
ncbi:hypothetical protein [Streptomyces microflavus]|uniref:hypothetical protein n=1 Tax=Streptomyces microflavus TaxID=1919 RepID=UPI0029C054F2|nr:hypothetical protein [Streptomyces microflavus]